MFDTCTDPPTAVHEAVSDTAARPATLRETLAAMEALLDAAATTELTDVDATAAWRLQASAVTARLVGAGMLSSHLHVHPDDPVWPAVRTLVAAHRAVVGTRSCSDAVAG